MEVDDGDRIQQDDHMKRWDDDSERSTSKKHSLTHGQVGNHETDPMVEIDYVPMIEDVQAISPQDGRR